MFREDSAENTSSHGQALRSRLEQNSLEHNGKARVSGFAGLNALAQAHLKPRSNPLDRGGPFVLHSDSRMSMRLI